MNRRNLFILALVLILGLALLARWMTQAHGPPNPPHPVEASASQPAPAQPPAVQAPPLAVAPAATAATRKPVRPGYSVRGRVYDESSGAGIAAASIRWRDADLGRYDGDFRSRPQTKSAIDGSFVLENVPLGRITLEVYATDHSNRDVDVVVTPDTSPVDVALSTGASISGRLAASDGVTPIVGSAGLYSLDESAGGEGRTGDDGTFSYKHLRPGRYQVTGRTAEGSASREVVLARNQHVEGLVLAMAAGRSIRGVVSGLRPDEISRARVSVRRADAFWSALSDASIDERGAYVLRSVQPGRLEVVAEVSMRRQLSKKVDMPADADLTVNIEFPAGARLSGRVTHHGQPLSGAQVSTTPVVEQAVHAYPATTSGDGRYAIEGLADGEYYVYVENYQAKPVTVSGDTVFDIDVPRAQLSGRVLEDGGKAPIAGVEVEVWPVEPVPHRFRQHNRSDESGEFRLTGLEAGELILTAYKPGYEMVRKRISYDAPIANMTMRMRQDAGVEIQLRDAATARPLHSAYVIEMIGDRNGTRFELLLSSEGIGYIPSALAGSTLLFSVNGYSPARVAGWNGRRLDMRLERTAAQ